jgi:uncharacterized protein YegL
MTKENFTSINVIIDKSGSMAGLAQDTIGSFNTFVKEQKDVPGEAAFTLCAFNHDYNLIHDFVKLTSVPDLDSKSYRPNGNTALLDALGTTINSVGQKLAAMPEDERPSKVIFLIITDGQENSSSKFSKEQIKSMVEHQRDAYKWEFVFVGANIDAFHDGQSYGVTGQNSVGYNATKGGTHQLYSSVSSNMRSYRMSSNEAYATASAGGMGFFDQTGQTPTTPVTVTPVTPVTPAPVDPTQNMTIPGVGPTDPADNTGSNQNNP